MRNGNLKIDNADKFSFSLAFLISFSFLRGFDEAALKKLGINFDQGRLDAFEGLRQKLIILFRCKITTN